jgi:protein-ribulosamine 3-kinase
MKSTNEQDVIRFCIEKLQPLFGTAVTLLGSRSVGGGCINNVLKISTSAGDFFLKWNVTSPSGLFLKEAEGLEEMRRSGSSLVIPKVIFSKEKDDLPGLILMEYLLPAGHTLGYEEQLGRGIALLHRKTAENYGFYHPNYCGTSVQENTWTESWSDFYAHRRIWPLVQQIQKQRGLSVDELKTYEKLVARLPGLIGLTTIPSLIHGDLWSGNFILTEHGPALVDPACYYANREMELGMMKLFGGFSSRVWEAYQQEWPLPVGWQQRN